MPLAPSPITLTYSTNSLGQIIISWFFSPGAVSYNIYTRNNIADGFGSPINVSPIITNSFIDNGFVANSTAYYNVTAVNAFGESLPSVTLQISQVAGAVLPRVDFHQTKFSKWIEEKGYRLKRESAL